MQLLEGWFGPRLPGHEVTDASEAFWVPGPLGCQPRTHPVTMRIGLLYPLCAILKAVIPVRASVPWQRVIFHPQEMPCTVVVRRTPLIVELLAPRLPCVALHVTSAPLAANLKVDLGLGRLGILDDGDSHHLEMV